jgi:hypothetical protein
VFDEVAPSLHSRLVFSEPVPVWAAFTPENSDLPPVRVLALAFGADGSLWAGTDGGGLARLDKEGHWQTYSKASTQGGLPADSVWAFRTLAMPKTAEPWSLTSLRERLIKIGAKVTSHGRYVTFQNGCNRGATADVRRNPVADRPAAGTACASMRERSDQMRQATTAKACHDLAKSGRFTVSVLSTAGFNRTLLALSTICRCPSRSKE